VRPGIAERVSPLAGPPAPPAYDALVSALINEVAAEPDQPGVLLVLDDYHLIGSDSVQASVRFLLAHRPPQLRVVLASRSDPPLGLARYRGRGELGEVRAADLRFNLDEAAELLRQVSADLDLSIAAALAERTEGWAVGLQLAALSLRTQPDVAQRSDQRAARIPLACLARLQRAFGDGHPAGGPAGSSAAADARVPRLVDQLTSRELEVLAMLAAGRSNQGIASHLVISLDTVKKHVSHLMGKLGAANRTEAVARGRELGLID
jgi:ATP/maltotriose-dependent transcriptional regulator MalT